MIFQKVYINHPGKYPVYHVFGNTFFITIFLHLIPFPLHPLVLILFFILSLSEVDDENQAKNKGGGGREHKLFIQW